MLAEYYKEKDGCEILEIPGAFAAFNVVKDQFYIAEMYVAPDFRKGLTKRELYSKLIDVAISRGCTYAACHLPLNSKHLNERLNTFYLGGFRLTGGMDDNRLVMVLQLKDAVLPPVVK